MTLVFELVRAIHVLTELLAMGSHSPLVRYFEVFSEARVDGFNIDLLPNALVDGRGEVCYSSPYAKSLEVGQDYDTMEADGVHYSPALNR